jgi:SAM-dependent methyltransferase
MSSLMIDLDAAGRLLWSSSALSFALDFPLSTSLSVSASSLLITTFIYLARRRDSIRGHYLAIDGFSPPVAFTQQSSPAQGIVLRVLLFVAAVVALCYLTGSRFPAVCVLAITSLHSLVTLVPCFGSGSYWRVRYWSERFLSLSGPRAEEWFMTAEDAAAICEHTQRLQSGARILIAGCGTSRVVDRLALLCPGAEVVACDISDVVIAQGKARCSTGRNSNVVFAKGDARDMREFSSGSFDLVLDKGTFAALEAVSLAEEVPAFCESHRLLKESGVLVTVGLGYPCGELLQLMRDRRVAWEVEAKGKVAGVRSDCVAFVLRPVQETEFDEHVPVRYFADDLTWDDSEAEEVVVGGGVLAKR